MTSRRLAAPVTVLLCALLVSVAGATVPTRYGEVERFGGFDESAYNGGKGGGPLTPGKVINSRGFAVDAQDATGGAQGTAVYVLERSTIGNGGEHTKWMVQKLGEKGAVLGTKSFTLSNGQFNAVAVQGLAVDHASGRLYALVVGQPAGSENWPVVQELVAWSTTPNGSKELVAATGLTADALGTGAGVLATQAQLKARGVLYQPQGIVVDQGDVHHAVAIEASDEKAASASGGNPGGNTIVQLVATATVGGHTTGEELANWSSQSVAAELGGKSFGPDGISANPDGSLLASLNDLAAGRVVYAVHLSADLSTATVLDKPELLAPAPGSLPSGGDFDQRPLGGLVPPFAAAGVGQSISSAGGSGAELVQLSTPSSSTTGGLYAAAFVPGRSEDTQTGRTPFYYFHAGATPGIEEPIEGEKFFQGNLGIRLLQPDGGGKIADPHGETIVNTLGNPVKEAACDLDSFEAMTFAAGNEGTLWVLEQGPDAQRLQSTGLANSLPGGQIVELAPLGEGAGEHATPCPQPSGTFTIEPAGGPSQAGNAELTVPAGTTVKFDASSLKAEGGVPFAYEWQLNSEDALHGKPVNAISEPSYSAPSPTTEYTYVTTGTYKVKLTLIGDYGSYTTSEGTVHVTPPSPPTAHFVVATAAPQVGTPVLFETTGSLAGSGSVEHYRWNWGDGSPEETVGPETTALAHLFTASGSHEVMLTVVNSLGMEGVYHIMVSVAAAPSPKTEGPKTEGPKTEGPKTEGPKPGPPPLQPDRSATNVAPHATNSNGSVKLELTCPATKSTCAGTVTIETANAVAAGKKSAKHKKKRLILGHATFHLAGGLSTTLTLHLSSVGATLLRQLKHLPVTVLVSAQDSFGDPGTQSVRVTLAAAASKKHKKKH